MRCFRFGVSRVDASVVSDAEGACAASRWLHTGDIGQWNLDGSMSIIGAFVFVDGRVSESTSTLCWVISRRVDLVW